MKVFQKGTNKYITKYNYPAILFNESTKTRLLGTVGKTNG